MPTFFSYSRTDRDFVHLVRLFLQPSVDEIFAYQESPAGDPEISVELNSRLRLSDRFVAFVGAKCSRYQRWEVDRYFRLMDTTETARNALVVSLVPEADAERAVSDGVPFAAGWSRISAHQQSPKDEEAAEQVARKIADKWNLDWKPFDGLPQDPHLFSYEKDIIEFFHNAMRLFPEGDLDRSINHANAIASDSERSELDIALDIQKKWRRGCPVVWPEVKDLAARPNLPAPPSDTGWVSHPTTPNALSEDEIGTFRPRKARVLIKALTESTESEVRVTEFSLLEAGPRRDLYYPRSANSLRIGIIVSGGIAPGVNAVIDGIVQRHFRYARHHKYLKGLKILGFQDGFFSISKHPRPQLVLLAPDKAQAGEAGCEGAVYTAAKAHLGGSILGTSRADALLSSRNRASNLKQIDEKLADLDILYVIGGDGTMKAAHALCQISLQNENRDHPLSVVAIPKDYGQRHFVGLAIVRLSLRS